MAVLFPFDTSMRDLTEEYGKDVAHGLLKVTGKITVIDANLATVVSEADKVLHVKGTGRKRPYRWVHNLDAQAEPPLTPEELSAALRRWREWLLHLEFQASCDPEIVWRLLHYSLELAFRHRLLVRSVAVLLRPEADHRSLTGRFVAPAATGIQEFRYEVLRVWKQKSNLFLEGGLGLVPLAPLSNTRVQDLPDLIRKMDRRIHSEATPAQSVHLWAMVGLLLGLRVDEDHSRALLKGVTTIMRESSTYQWIRKEGIEEGIETGIERGRLEGLTLGQRSLLIEMATDRWWPPNAEIGHRLEAMTDPLQIRFAAKRLVNATGWNDLLD